MKKYDLGKIDFYGTGRKINRVIVKIELKETKKGPVFSACGEIWNAKETDIVSGGQNLDTIANFKGSNPYFKEIYRLWRLYHLNDMHAGTERQENHLNDFFKKNKLSYDYDKAIDELKQSSLYYDNGYEYGSGWLYREIPEKDLMRIKQLLGRAGEKNHVSSK